MNKAFIFSTEATIALLMLSALIIVQQPLEKKDLHDLLIFQKENDLLKIWAKEQKFSLEEMKKDFEIAFPNSNGIIRVNENSILIGKTSGKKSVSAEANFLNCSLEEKKISITVFQ